MRSILYILVGWGGMLFAISTAICKYTISTSLYRVRYHRRYVFSENAADSGGGFGILIYRQKYFSCHQRRPPIYQSAAYRLLLPRQCNARGRLIEAAPAQFVRAQYSEYIEQRIYRPTLPRVSVLPESSKKPLHGNPFQGKTRRGSREEWRPSWRRYTLFVPTLSKYNFIQYHTRVQFSVKIHEASLGKWGNRLRKQSRQGNYYCSTQR